MEKYITFKEKDLKDTITSIERHLSTLNLYIEMAQEQKMGERDNLKVEDFAVLKSNIESIKHIIKGFNIS